MNPIKRWRARLWEFTANLYMSCCNLIGVRAIVRIHPDVREDLDDINQELGLTRLHGGGDDSSPWSVDEIARVLRKWKGNPPGTRPIVDVDRDTKVPFVDCYEFDYVPKKIWIWFCRSRRRFPKRIIIVILQVSRFSYSDPRNSSTLTDRP